MTIPNATGQEHPEYYTLQGVVSDAETKETLIGATIRVEDAHEGAVTNHDGLYKLILPQGYYTIICSYLGYGQKEIRLTLVADQELNIVLSPTEEFIDEVRIISQRKFFGNMEYGREIPTIGAESIEKQNSTNASDILHARLAGIWATKTSGAPGDHQKIRIRGQSSFFNSAEPLYVVDGVPVPIVNLASLGIADLNVHDINNITVLKDASSSALYGFQGGNGVILIDTKSGEENQFNYTSRFGYQWFSDFYDLMPVQNQYAALDSIDSQFGSILKTFYPPFSEELCDRNYQDEIFNPGSVMEHQLSAGGAIGKAHFYLSGNYTNHQGINPESQYTRYTGLIHLNRTFRDRLTIDLSYRISQQENLNNQDQYKGHRLLFEGISRSPCLECTPDSLLFGPEDKYTRILRRYDPLNDHEYPSEIENQSRHTLSIRNHALNLSGRYRIGAHLSLNAKGSLMYRHSVYDMDYAYYDHRYYRAYLKTVCLNSRENVFLINHQYSLNYNRQFSQHKFDLAVAYRNYTDNLWWTVDTVEGELNNYSYLRNSMAAYGVDGSVVRAMQSYLANASYNFRDKYFLSLVGNLSHIREGLYIDYFTLFPSIAFSWDISRESFIRDISWIDYIKPYANWGISGNYPLNGLANDLYQQVTYSQVPGDRTQFPAILQFANHYLKHEETRETDVGMQIGLFNRRLNLQGVLFQKKIDNLIIQRKIPDYYGGGNEYYNIGLIDVTGYEISLEASPVQSRNLLWYMALNLSSSTQTIAEIYEQRPMIFEEDDILMPAFIIREGEQLGNIYGYESLGRWTDQDDAEMNPLHAKYGGLKFLNADTANPAITPDDRVSIGNSIPDLAVNFFNTLSYKGFSIEMQWYGLWGPEKFNATRAATIMTVVNPEVIGYVADSITALRYNYFYQSSEFIEDASFIRLKSLRISYEPEWRLMDKVGMAFSISFENLITLTRYKGYDPEATIFTNNNFSDNAIDRGAVPNPKAVYISFGINF